MRPCACIITCSTVTCSLMEACFHGRVECAKLLVAHGSSCLARDYSGFSSLHYAVDGGNIDMVNFVLNQGVDVSTHTTYLIFDLTLNPRLMMRTRLPYLGGHH